MRKATSNNDLARMIAAGFEEVHKRFNQTVSKDEFRILAEEVQALKKGVRLVQVDISDINNHLRVIEDAFAMPDNMRFKSRPPAL